MKSFAILFLALSALAPAALGAEGGAGPGTAILIRVEGAIGPATSAYVADAIADAEERGARLLIMEMDTPGGLDTSMRAIVKAVLASSVAVVGYFAPSGARAASAGTYILYACHIAAMAPGTNLGAATPVQIGGLGGGNAPEQGSPGEDKKSGGDAMTHKLVNDAVAYIVILFDIRTLQPYRYYYIAIFFNVLQLP
jgi:membrane-bound serine protease (ClpP class)